MLIRLLGELQKTGGVGTLLPDLQRPDIGDALDVQEPLLVHLQFLLNLTQENLPIELSVSYGEDEQSHPVSWMKTVCQLFAKLGARGVSILVAKKGVHSTSLHLRKGQRTLVAILA